VKTAGKGNVRGKGRFSADQSIGRKIEPAWMHPPAATAIEPAPSHWAHGFKAPKDWGRLFDPSIDDSLA
jgi:hypothetical protein